MPPNLRQQTLDGYIDTKFFLGLAHGGLFGRLAGFHMAAGECEIVLPEAVTFNQGQSGCLAGG